MEKTGKIRVQGECLNSEKGIPLVELCLSQILGKLKDNSLLLTSIKVDMDFMRPDSDDDLSDKMPDVKSETTELSAMLDFADIVDIHEREFLQLLEENVYVRMNDNELRLFINKLMVLYKGIPGLPPIESISKYCDPDNIEYSDFNDLLVHHSVHYMIRKVSHHYQVVRINRIQF